jgi:hypothetical protein
MRVAGPSRLPGMPVVSYTTFSPLPVHYGFRRYISVVLSTDYSVRLLTGIVPYGVRTFLATLVTQRDYLTYSGYYILYYIYLRSQCLIGVWYE